MSDGSPRIDLLTLNLWNRNGPVRRRLADLAAYLRRRPPDLVALQEVTSVDAVLQSHALAEGAGYPHVHHDRAWRSSRREEGLAVLSRWPLRALPPTPIPQVRRDQPRLLQRVVVEVGHRPLLVANTHLTWRRRDQAARAAQARAVRDVLAGHRGPRALLGDLNDVIGSPALEVLTLPDPDGAGLRAVGGPGTPPVAAASFSWRNSFARRLPWLLGRRVDHVLVSPDIDVERAGLVLTGRDAPIVSDHFGVRAALAIRNPVARE